MSYMMDGTPLGEYQQTPAQQSAERYRQLSNILRTEESFKRSIDYMGDIVGVIGLVFSIALIVLVINGMLTSRIIAKHSGLSVGDFMDALFSTVNGRGDISPWRVFLVYTPLAATLVLIVLIIVAKVTFNSSLTKVYDDYRRGGFIAEPVLTGIRVSHSIGGNGVCFIGAPSVSPEQVRSAAQRATAAATTDPKSKEAKAYVKKMDKLVTRGGGLSAYQANQADPMIPAGIFAAHWSKLGIAVPHGNDYTKINLYSLKKDVPIPDFVLLDENGDVVY